MTFAHIGFGPKLVLRFKCGPTPIIQRAGWEGARAYVLDGDGDIDGDLDGMQSVGWRRNGGAMGRDAPLTSCFSFATLTDMRGLKHIRFARVVGQDEGGLH